MLNNMYVVRMIPLKMCRNSLYFIFLAIFFSKVHSEKLTFLNLTESFDPLKLLKVLADVNSTSSCHLHVSALLSDLKSEKSWALQMYDSSAKTQSGLLTGNTGNPGQYDECLDVEGPERNFTGQHCMLEWKAYYKNNGSDFNLYKLIDEDDMNKEWTMYDIRLGLCVPSTCTPNDIEESLNSMFNESKLDEIISVKLDDADCKTKNSGNLDFWRLLPLLVFVVISILSTIFDVTHQKISSSVSVKSSELYSSFSLYKNGKTLFQITNSTEQLKPLHGMRVLTTFWVALIHFFIAIYLFEPSINTFGTFKAFKDVQHLPIYHGLLAVDTFFFLSGMLICIVFFRDIKKKGCYDILLGYIHRYIRLTPSYAAMLYVSAHVYPYLGDGPYWEEKSHEQEICRKYWWTGILYIQNFVNPMEICLGQSWYLSADMQLHWVSPLILFFIYFWPAFVKSILGVTLLFAVCTNFTVGYVYNLGPMLWWSQYTKQFTIDYSKFYMRAAPYIIGLGTGYFINKIRSEKTKIKLNKIQVLIGWLGSTVLCVAVMYGSLPLADFKNNSTFTNVSYLTLHRVAWGLGLGWIVFACLNGFGGIINAFLSLNVFQPFSKLSYSVYLIHTGVMFFKLETIRTNYYKGDATLIYDFFACLGISHLLAIPLTLIFEMPFGNLDRYFFKNVKLVPVPWKRRNQTGESKSQEEIRINFNKNNM